MRPSSWIFRTQSLYDFINKEKDPCEMMSTLPQDVLLVVCDGARAVKGLG